MHAEAVNTLTEACAISLIAITQEVLGCRVPWECYNHLLRSPLGRRMTAVKSESFAWCLVYHGQLSAERQDFEM